MLDNECILITLDSEYLSNVLVVIRAYYATLRITLAKQHVCMEGRVEGWQTFKEKRPTQKAKPKQFHHVHAINHNHIIDALT